ncbi:glycoside hydrolase family 3 protein [Ramlibacter sp. MAH-25]|uniref:beta-glucosidase n=2 Tax=Comamonadaceae TaxID=80864 RepID=A0A6N8IZ78_9BURK|nr:glycoside hydrolase family 3 C-terminal domain-containing protein [Ramlibacter sp. CGMCC 1.13660]MVQ31350.1 glycoside hydrolase family 3 protein [Ramlibacter pinisoli]
MTVIAAAVLHGCGGGSGSNQAPAASVLAGQGVTQPAVQARVKPLLQLGPFSYRDLNNNGKVDQYENWRLPVDVRVKDLVRQMTLAEKAGMLLINTLNAPGGTTPLPGAEAQRLVNDEGMTRFIFRSAVQLNGSVSPQRAAEFTNSVQELAEATRLGIPVIFKSNARNHYDRSARQGINEPAGSFSEWPKEPGLAATRDMALIRDFGDTIGQEWAAIGLRGSYAYMADTATEPRWFRVHETFSESAGLNADIMKNLVLSWQGGPVDPNTRVAMTIKHFPGGGPAAGGLDAHYTFGKFASYSGGLFAEHLKPFQAAIEAGVSAIMPYYSVPTNLTHDGVTFDQVGFAFNRQAITDLLRTRLGFKGYVNSDTGIITQRAWGLESKSTPERIAAAVNAGVDVLSGFSSKQEILDVVAAGLITEARLDEAVTALLREQFALGLFENPYVDAARANDIVGKPEFLAKALDAQRRSLTLLKNDTALPLKAPQPAAPVKLYSVNLNTSVLADPIYGGYTVVSGDRTAANGNIRPAVPAGTDYAVVRVEVSNNSGAYRSNDPATGANPAYINPRTGKTWGADDPAGIDDRLTFGGAYPWEVDILDFTGMAAAQSWRISPSLADIQATMAEARAVGAKVVLSIYFRQPYVLDDASGLKNANAIVANYGVSDTALMDVLTGKSRPQGKLPWALARNAQAIKAQDPDAPGYPAADTLFPFGFGLTY